MISFHFNALNMHPLNLWKKHHRCQEFSFIWYKNRLKNDILAEKFQVMNRIKSLNGKAVDFHPAAPGSNPRLGTLRIWKRCPHNQLFNHGYHVWLNRYVKTTKLKALFRSRTEVPKTLNQIKNQNGNWFLERDH